MAKKTSYRTHGISWPNADLLQAARSRAKALGLSFSKYINELVQRDVEGGGDFTLRERRPPRVPNGDH